ncbi:prephenate dehydrogenase [Listeria rocourtiae FSL F6-920]|nr:prephenate dehydrogenase [Listeria rocourtiae FSL F6-920]
MKGTVVIVGLGLIGGSIALCIRARHPKAHIIGVDISEQTILAGDSLGIIDEGTTNLADVIADADLLIFCCPVQQTEKIFSRAARVSIERQFTDNRYGKYKNASDGTCSDASGSGIHVYWGASDGGFS